MSDIDSSYLLQWFEKNKRSFPWRPSPDPYRVWVSEVMLQQTRANVVVPYFERWMKLFPDLASLAQADLSLVLKAWEGLGYYSRARNLYLGAKEIMQKYQGRFPSSKEELLQIKGLGPYTVGAILSFAFEQKEPCVDGNVMRVFARYFGIEEDISLGQTKKTIWGHVKEALHEAPSPRLSEAFIELGALVCQKKPLCSACPLQEKCLAHKRGREMELPFKGKKILFTKLIRTVLVLECEGTFLVQKGKAKEIMADLYEFPYWEVEKKERPSEVREKIAGKYGKNLILKRKYPLVKQTFTRFRVDLHPFHFLVPEKKEMIGFEWVSLQEARKTLTFSSAHRKILQLIPNIRNKVHFD